MFPAILRLVKIGRYGPLVLRQIAILDPCPNLKWLRHNGGRGPYRMSEKIPQR
jgi:hypothetical protein